MKYTSIFLLFILLLFAGCNNGLFDMNPDFTNPYDPDNILPLVTIEDVSFSINKGETTTITLSFSEAIENTAAIDKSMFTLSGNSAFVNLVSVQWSEDFTSCVLTLDISAYTSTGTETWTVSFTDLLPVNGEGHKVNLLDSDLSFIVTITDEYGLTVDIDDLSFNYTTTDAVNIALTFSAAVTNTTAFSASSFAISGGSETVTVQNVSWTGGNTICTLTADVSAYDSVLTETWTVSFIGDVVPLEANGYPINKTSAGLSFGVTITDVDLPTGLDNSDVTFREDDASGAVITGGSTIGTDTVYVAVDTSGHTGTEYFTLKYTTNGGAAWNTITVGTFTLTGLSEGSRTVDIEYEHNTNSTIHTSDFTAFTFTVGIPPAPVTGLAATAGDGEVLLEWTNPSDSDLDKIEISWTPADAGGSTTVTDPVAGSADSETITGLTNDTEYTFSVVAVDNLGNESSAETKTATPVDTTGPGPVTGLTLTPGDGQVMIEWTNPSDSDLDVIAISWTPADAGGSTTVTDPVAGSADSETVTGLTNSTEYTFTLIAKDTSGNPSTSAQDTATPSGNPFVAYDIVDYLFTGGNINGVTVDGSYMYAAASGTGLIICDISTPGSPSISAIISTPSGYPYDVAVSGNYAYVADQASGLCIVDISNKTAPSIESSISTADYAYGVAVSGNYAYIADDNSGLTVIDITNKSSPTLETTLPLTGTYGAQDIVLDGSYAYVAKSSDGLVIVDISTPTSPSVAGSLDTSGDMYGLVKQGNYVYSAHHGNYVKTIDVSTPSSPLEVNSDGLAGPIGSNPHEIATDGSYLYVAGMAGGLFVFDISTPADPSKVGDTLVSGSAYGVCVTGTYSYVAGTSGLSIVDVSTPASPSHDDTLYTGGAARCVAISGDTMCISDESVGFIIADISDPAAPVVQSITAGSTERVIMSGTTAYVVGLGKTLSIYNVSTPSSPSLTGSVTVAGFEDPKSLALYGSYAFVAGYTAGIAIIDISTPSNPTHSTTYTGLGYPEGIVINGDYAYVANYGDGYAILDISDPTSPSIVGSGDPGGGIYDVAYNNGYIFLANYNSVFRVIDVDPPASSFQAATLSFTGNSMGCTYSNGYVFQGSRGGGLHIFDVTTPTTPEMVKNVTIGGDTANAVYDSSSGYIYVADRLKGVVIVGP